MQIKEIRLGNIVLSSNVLMAPLAGYTCYSFRMLVRELGAGLSFTEMVSCNALKYKDQANQKLLITTHEEKIKAVQLLGADPRIMERMAAGRDLEEFDIIDINMGCPVPNVFKSGEGSALMKDLKRASKLIGSCKRSGKLVTVKCRVGLEKNKLIAAEFAKMCEESGADMLTIHGRTRDMMYQGIPFYNQIAQAKAAVRIPVIANGGIFSVREADAMMELTGADGVMIARYALENPFIFSELTHTRTKKNRCDILLEQLELTRKYYSETDTIQYIRKLAAYGMKKKKGTKRYKQILYESGSLVELKNVIQQIFSTEERVEF